MEPRNFRQLGLDFARSDGYIDLLKKETESLNHELLETLELKLDELLNKYSVLKDENNVLREENLQLKTDRQGLKFRIDQILSKIENV